MIGQILVEMKVGSADHSSARDSANPFRDEWDGILDVINPAYFLSFSPALSLSTYIRTYVQRSQKTP